MKELKILLRFADSFYARPLFILFIVLLFADIFYLSFFYEEKEPEVNEGSMVTISGVVREIKYDENGVMKNLKIGDSLCYVNKISILEEVLSGDRVKVFGTINYYEEPVNEGELNQVYYNMSQGIKNYVYAESVTLIGKKKINIAGRLRKLNQSLAKRILLLAQREGGTVNTLILGDRSNLTEDREALYSFVSISHFIVISGLHVSIIGMMVYAVFKKLLSSIKLGVLAALTIIIFYGMFTGFSISIRRGIIMFGVRLFSEFFEKNYDSVSSLSLAGIIEIIINPFSVYSASFIYSYGSVFAFSFYYSFIKPYAFKHKMGFYKIFEIPVYVFLFMLPISLNLSYEYSFSSVFVNIFLGIYSPFVLILCLFTGMFSVLGLSKIVYFLDFLLSIILKSLDLICRLFMKMDFFYFSGKPKLIFTIMYYVLLFFSIYCFHKKIRILGIITAILSLQIITSRYMFGADITYPYVGQGDLGIISLNKESVILIDGGSSSESELYKYVLKPLLKFRGTKIIEDIYLSHEDEDHINGIIDLLKDEYSHVKVKRIILPENLKDEGFKEVIMLAKKRGIKISYISTNDKIIYDDFKISCLYPGTERKLDNNGNSLVLLLEKGETKVLFSGDMTNETEELLMNNVPEIDILKVAHHGSNTSSSDKFIEKLNPKVAIISAGKNNKYGHPHKETLDTLKKYGCEILCTKYMGEIKIGIP